MSFQISPFPGQTYARAYADHRDIRAYLGWGKLVERRWRLGPAGGMSGTYTTVESKKLPVGFCGSVIVPLADGRTTKLVCNMGNSSSAGMRGKSSTHRVYAECPDCAAMVPAGRAHQHKCK
jgi:hypothetical protein